MRKAALTVLIAFALVLGFTAIADAAPTAAYKVTLTTTTTSEAGKFVVVSGKVTGPKATGKTVTIQRRYVGGPWTTVTVATVRKNGSYSARVETPRGGSTSFRAIKAKSSARKAGVSPTRTMKVYEWLYLANEGSLADGNVTQPYEQKIGSTVYKRSIAFFHGDASTTYKLGNLCTKLTTLAVYQAPGISVASSATFAVTRRTTSTESTTNTILDLGSATTVGISLAGTSYLTMAMSGIGSGNSATLGDPRVYCNADHLPSVVLADIIS